jgi:Flp pilus assembly protein TadG
VKPRRRTGSTTLEFALVLILLFTFLLGILDFSRMLFTWNAANEAARAGARFAVVCDNTGNKAEVLARMKALMPQIADISLQWTPAACTSANCESVKVTITALNYQWISPIAGAAKLAAIPMPQFSTFLSRELMRQDPHPEVCA